MLHKFLWATISLMVITPSFAQEQSDKKTSKSLTFSGFTDGYYRYDFSGKITNNRTSFTNAHNSFELGMASIKMEGKSGKVGFVADLGIGKREQEFAYTDAGLMQGIKQLYFSYAPADWIKFTMGSWATHVGYELVDAPANRNYSMSYMFSWGPFFHTGIKTEFTSGKSGFMIGIANPTDYKMSQTGSKKAILAQYSLAITEKTKLYLNYVDGQRPADSMNIRQFDVVFTTKLSDHFNLGYNGTYQKTKQVTQAAKTSNQDPNSWWGSAIYLNVDPSEKWGFTLRSELYNDKKQLGAMAYAPVGAGIFANTLSFQLKSGPLTIIPELRLEHASQQVFLAKNGLASSNTASALLAAVYSF